MEAARREPAFRRLLLFVRSAHTAERRLIKVFQQLFASPLA